MQLTESAVAELLDLRTGRNIRHGITALLRQSIYSRLAGYKDVNDARRGMSRRKARPQAGGSVFRAGGKGGILVENGSAASPGGGQMGNVGWWVLGSVLGGCAAPASSQYCPLFPLNGRSFPTSSDGRQVVLVDMDLDGDRDAVVSGWLEPNVSVMLNDGRGVFVEGGSSEVGVRTDEIVVGDFNGDGLPDVAAANFGATTSSGFGGVSLYLNDGAGGLVNTFDVTGWRNVRDIAAADFDRDGRLDVVVTGTPEPVTLPERVRVYYGDGAGGLDTGGTFNINVEKLNDVEVGDVNGDGTPDIVTIGSRPSQIQVLLNAESGFLTMSPLPLESDYAYDVLLRDFSGDGVLDVMACVWFDEQELTGSLWVLAGNGVGEFSKVTDVPTPFPCDNLELVEIDGDAEPEILVDGRSSQGVDVVDVTGSLGFEGPELLPMGAITYYADGGDVNGDGEADLVVVHGGLGILSVTLGPVRGESITRRALEVSTRISAMVVGSFFDGGGDDLVLNSMDLPVLLLLEGPAYDAESGLVVPLPGIGTDARGADLDGDGDTDVVVSLPDSDEVCVLLSDGAGGFAAPVHHSIGPGPGLLLLRDVNGDGWTDVVSAINTASELGLLLGDGKGGFEPAPNIRLFDDLLGPRSDDFDAGDLNDDGYVDIVAVDMERAGYFISLGGPGGMFTPSGPAPSGYMPSRVALFDIEGDGLLEIIGFGDVPAGDWIELEIVRFEEGGFVIDGERQTLHSRVQDYAVVDLDDDGIEDLVTVSDSDGHVILFPGGRAIDTAAAARFEAVGRASRIGTPDLDKDGRADIVVGAGEFRWVTAFENRCPECPGQLSEPLGSFDYIDVLAFLVAFADEEEIADLAPPYGAFDFSDVFAFLAAVGGGCP